MRLAINLLLVAIIGVLIYLLIVNISEPIAFRAEKDLREDAVKARLIQIRTSQEMYRNIYGEYASDFKTLVNGLDTGQFSVVKVTGGDVDDPNANPLDFTYDTLYFPAKDSIENLDIDMDSLSIVPYGSTTAKFFMTADTLTYQKTLTHVMEAGVRRKEFMGKYADPLYAKYDDRYNPNSIMQFGSLDGPNLGGNWE